MSAPKLTGNRCQCTVCGESLNGVQSFVHHRIGDHGINRRCQTVAGLEAARWNRNAAGFWCERADPNAKPRAPAIPPRFAPSARATPSPATQTFDFQPAQVSP